MCIYVFCFSCKMKARRRCRTVFRILNREAPSSALPTILPLAKAEKRAKVIVWLAIARQMHRTNVRKCLNGFRNMS